MRKLVLAFGISGLTAAIALVACSSDDSGSTGGTDAGSGADSTADVFVPPKDSGTKDSGAACQTCSNFLVIGPQGTPCTDNGPPSSADLINAFFNCFCNPDGGGCYTRCGTTCTEFTNPTDDCVACFSSTCSAEVAACEADGTDAGPPNDAGSDGGDGGDGG